MLVSVYNNEPMTSLNSCKMQNNVYVHLKWSFPQFCISGNMTYRWHIRLRINWKIVIQLIDIGSLIESANLIH